MGLVEFSNDGHPGFSEIPRTMGGIPEVGLGLPTPSQKKEKKKKKYTLSLVSFAGPFILFFSDNFFPVSSTKKNWENFRILEFFLV
jgi:hypothetical protein